MSVEKYVVTASIRLDGMNESAIHVKRRFQSSGARAIVSPRRSSLADAGTGRAARRHPAATETHARSTNTA